LGHCRSKRKTVPSPWIAGPTFPNSLLQRRPEGPSNQNIENNPMHSKEVGGPYANLWSGTCAAKLPE
jgi:hypothetical protein